MPSLIGALLGLAMGLVIGFMLSLGAFTVLPVILLIAIGVHIGLGIEERDVY